MMSPANVIWFFVTRLFINARVGNITIYETVIQFSDFVVYELEGFVGLFPWLFHFFEE